MILYNKISRLSIEKDSLKGRLNALIIILRHYYKRNSISNNLNNISIKNIESEYNYNNIIKKYNRFAIIDKINNKFLLRYY